ncbi:hypothetical protein WK68_31535 [Burkholderia ubonensis]|uniref:DUF1842 domain-containing protein n=1 Tax=Burkholderia ubonensis TaxID=101571 RepID=UPI000759018C|nr:DUF1842 domain-containing protein [Burkholderia ubonensis]KVU49487.1 hypothetical protein WK68_31535 [Burkholderia ubonensis]
MSAALFPVNFRVATPVIGAPVLTLALVVNPPAKKVSGVARISQTTWPTLEFRAQVWGQFNPMVLVPGARTQLVLSLQGSPSGPTSSLAETFQLQGIVDADWKSGVASYRFFDGERWREVEHAIMTAVGTLQPLESDKQSVVPLYGVGLQQARESGDLSRMKALAREAEQQLADAGRLEEALAGLIAEIARLEARR